MRRRPIAPIVVGLAVALASVAVAQPARSGLPAEPDGLAPTGADMPTVGGNLANQHYSGLTQITKQNLHKLGPVWRTHVSAVAPATDDVGQQTTPIVADGVIYVDTPNGEVIAVDGATGAAKWKWAPQDFGTNGTRRGVSIGDGKVYTLAAGNRVVALDKDTGEEVWVVQPTGKELWRFQTGSGIASAPITYEIDGEQYVAIFAAGSTNPYGGSVTQGDSLWAFKLGGTYVTESGSSEGPDTAPLSIRRPVQGGPVEGATVNNTVYLARGSRTSDTANQRDSRSQGAMQPTYMRVPVGTTVTFLNPGAETFPNFPNQLPHCATQYFEGLFNAKLNPGESFQYTFDRAGEYFFNDCTDPRPAGKIEVYLEPQDVPGALRFTPGRLDLGSKTGIFTGVHGFVTAQFDIPAGYELDGDVVLQTPLSESPVKAARVVEAGTKLIVWFRKADLDNNVPVGDAVPLTLVANFLHDNVQTQLTSTATPKIVK